MSFTGFEHKLLKFLRESDSTNFKGKEVYVACSGGADSVALVKALTNLSKILEIKVNLLHIHHGEIEDLKQNNYRDKAVSFCKALANKLELDFILKKSEKGLISEEACRDYRQTIFEDFETVFLAHHKDDLLETLVLRLIRGTGLQGMAEPFSNRFKRPFLKLFNRTEIIEYLSETDTDYLEDPSNNEDQYLRNWLRNSWLPELKKARGLNGLTESLNLISEEARALKGEGSADYLDISFKFEEDEISGFFAYKTWLSLNRFQKQSRIAHILLKCLEKAYTKGQINEVVKLLERDQKNLKFNLAGLNWTKDIEKITFKKQV